MAEDNKQNRIIQVLSALVARSRLFSQMGKQYGTDRDVYEVLGYPTEITYDQYASRYTRQDIAKAIINRPISMTWKGPLVLEESSDDEETEFEKAWKALEKRLRLKSRFVRLDKLASLGEYGVLLLGFSDVGNTRGFATPVVPTASLKLNYVKPLTADSASINTYVKDPGDPRYGMPETYKVQLATVENEQSKSIVVHYSRVIHVTVELLEGEINGEPVLKSVYNRLMDLEKLVGGSAEMFWRGARPGYQGLVDADADFTSTELDELQDQIDEYENKLRRILILQGVKLEELQSQVANPKDHVDVIITMISAVTGIPKRILMGSERGELASTQDETSWYNTIQNRREEYAKPNIIDPFVEKMIELGILPEPKDGKYSVMWEDLYASSEKDKAEIGKIRAEALAKYAGSPTAESIVPPEAFFEWFLGFNEGQIELIQQMSLAAIEEEQHLIREGQEEAPSPPVEEEEETEEENE